MPTVPSTRRGVGGVGGEGGGGLRLGPATNTFTGASKDAAETARDTYQAANATWLAEYDDNETLVIVLSYGSTTTYQSRRGSAWADVTPILRGPRGLNGVDGQGFLFGPEQNTFTGDSKDAAEISRDSYITDFAPAGWADAYQNDYELVITLTYGDTVTYQSFQSGGWVDITPILTGPEGATGPAGPAGPCGPVPPPPPVVHSVS